jgi:hypothetical protein
MNDQASAPPALTRISSKLSFDADESVRKSVARHQNTSRAVLERLAADPQEMVRSMAAERLRERESS